MEKTRLREVAAQLACPNGEMGVQLSAKLNEANAFITARAIEALAPCAGETIVELGPGNGELSCGLVEQLGPDGRYLGIEISTDMVPLVEQTLRSVEAACVDIHEGDCYSAEVEEASIDGLLAVNVLYFIDDLDRMLARIRPWFRPGGRCVFGIRPTETLTSLGFHEFGYQIRTPAEIEQALNHQGFGTTSWSYFDEGEGRIGDLTFPTGSIIIRAVVPT